MRCMVCGEEMRLVGIVFEESMPVEGFQRHILRCPGCRDKEERLVFNRPPDKFMPEHDAPPLSAEEEAAKQGEERIREAMESVQGPKSLAARAAWLRTAARLRGRNDED